MKKLLILLTVIMICHSVTLAQEKLYMHRQCGLSLGVLTSSVDSITFDNDDALFFIDGSSSAYRISDLDSISFGSYSYTIYINYSDNSVSIVNPLAFEGVEVSANGTDVTVNSTTEVRDIIYSLSGSASNGTFKLYSEKRYNVELNGLNLTNNDGPAINIQSSKKCSLTLVDGTTNALSDGSAYAAAVVTDNVEEDQKAVFFCEGQVLLDGQGSLTINGKNSDKHAFCSDDYIEINGGSITVSGTSKDGIHGKDGIYINGGTLNVTCSSDAIDGDEAFVVINGGNITINSSAEDINGISSDSIINISGGTIDITISGAQSKGIKCNGDINLLGGNITINNSGKAAVVDYDPAYCTAIKSEGKTTVNGAEITIRATGIASRGIVSDTDIDILGGTTIINSTGAGSTYTTSSNTTDSYHAVCLKSNGNMNIIGGYVSTTSTGTAGKGLVCDGKLTVGSSSTDPTLTLKTSGSKITVSSSSSTSYWGGGMQPGGGMGGMGGSSSANYDEAKTIKCTGDIEFISGTTTISSADDGLKSDGSIIVSGGTLTISNSTEGIEAPIITFNGGNISIISSDDCFNATYGNGGESNDGSILTINGGYIVLNASGGDALDSNGSIKMTGGTVVAHGPASQPEVGLDYNGTFLISGGLLIVSGINSNNLQTPGTSSSQYSVKITTSSYLTSSTFVRLQTSTGVEIATFKPVRNCNSIVISSPSIKSGASCSAYTGGTYTGGNNNGGLYLDGTYSGGTLKKTFSISSKVTSVSF